MSTLTVIGVILYTIVGWTLIWNFIRLFVESKKLKENKQTPLVGKTSLTIVVAAIAEVLLILVMLKLFSIGFVPMNDLGVIFTFGATALLRTLVSYLATWGLWGFFVRRDKKKQLEKIQQEVKNGTSQ